MDRADELARKALEKSRDEKRKQWEWIKSEWPGLAEHLIEINKQMGKPQEVRIFRD